MSANGLDVFDKTLQTTHIWLDEIMERLGPDRQVAWKVLSTVLHKLRDRLPVEAAAHLGAQLPLLVRGAYYDQFEPAKQPARCRTREEFVAPIAANRSADVAFLITVGAVGVTPAVQTAWAYGTYLRHAGVMGEASRHTSRWSR